MSDKYQGGILAGSTSVSIDILLRKKSDNTELTGLLYNTAGNIASYRRQGAARVAITLATQTVTGAWSAGGLVEIDATNMPGMYRVDVPDAAFASGVDYVDICLVTTNGYAYYERIPLTSNVIQSGDAYARLGAAGAGLTALGDTRIANLDTTVSSRGTSTYAGGDTAGTTTLLARLTATRAGLLDNLDAAVSGIASSVWGFATRVLTAGTNIVLAKGAGITGLNDLSSAQVTAAATAATPTAAAVTAGVTVATNTDKTGYSLTVAPPSAAAIRAEMDANSTQLAGILTNIGNLSNLSNYANIFGSPVLEIPDSGATLIPYRFVFKDADGHLVDVDTNTVTLAAKNAAGTDRSANWSAVAHESTGCYTATYSVSSSATKEGLLFAATATVASAARRADFGALVEDVDTVTTLASILSYASRIPTSPAAVSDVTTAVAPLATEANATTNKNTVLTRLGSPAGVSIAADVAEVAADTDTLLTRNNALDASGVRAAVGLAAASLDTQLGEIAGDTDTLLTRNNPLDAPGIRTAVGLASANLDTQLATHATEANATTNKAAILALLGTPAGASLAADLLTKLATSGYTAPLSAAGVRSALGLGAANLDTQLGELAADTDALITSVAAVPTAAQNADKLLGRKQSGGSDGILGNRVSDMLAKKLHDNGDNTATVTNEDGTTYTLTITRADVAALTSVS